MISSFYKGGCVPYKSSLPTKADSILTRIELGVTNLVNGHKDNQEVLYAKQKAFSNHVAVQGGYLSFRIY